MPLRGVARRAQCRNGSADQVIPLGFAAASRRLPAPPCACCAQRASFLLSFERPTRSPGPFRNCGNFVEVDHIITSCSAV
jgi:hypothetical protein